MGRREGAARLIERTRSGSRATSGGGRRFWSFALGAETSGWQGVAHDLVLGWWTLGDVRRCKSRAALRRESPEGADACWNFARVMDVGDVVLAVKGGDRVLGIGVVTGGYRYEVDRETVLGHRRRVEWIATGARRPGVRFDGAALAELDADDGRVGQVFAAYGKTLADADPDRFRDRCWWLATNVDYWSLDNEVAVGETFFYYKYNEHGHVRTSGRSFDEIQAGDLVLGYVGGPVRDRGVHCLLRCVSGLCSGEYEGAWRDNVVVFRKERELRPIIPWEVFRDNPVLMSAHMVRVKNVGSLFGFTPEQRDEVRRILGLYVHPRAALPTRS